MLNAKINVYIPTYKPDNRFVRAIEMLERQTVPVNEIHIINTEQKYWTANSDVANLSNRYSNLFVEHISSDDFDHGGTRRKAVQKCDTEFFLMMTQDALPADEKLVENLLKAFVLDEKIAVSYARQLPNTDAKETEKYIRSFNYPDESVIKSEEDANRLGIKAYFCSNVCAMYRTAIYNNRGGFVVRTIFNEDMIYAGLAVKDGYKIAYQANAKVFHSHNYSGIAQLHRNFDLAVSQVEHPEVFGGLKSESEGIKLLKDMISHLKQVHKLYLVPGFVYNCGMRYLGYKLGRNYTKLSKRLILKLTSNKTYWQKGN